MDREETETFHFSLTESAVSQSKKNFIVNVTAAKHMVLEMCLNSPLLSSADLLVCFIEIYLAAIFMIVKNNKKNKKRRIEFLLSK